jgi:chemotaxis protein histidine kinase CheA
MQIADLQRVLHDEFVLAAEHIDARLASWLEGGAEAAPQAAAAMAAEWQRLAESARLLSLEGLALALDQLRDAAQVLAMLDEDGMGEGLGWLCAWREPLAAVFAEPGRAAPAWALVEHLAQGPMAPEGSLLSELHTLLLQRPALDNDEAAAALPPASDDDVSLALPADIDLGLYETFLADAPGQMARLGDAVRQLVAVGLAPEPLAEAQRVAHTFKGSGNIIGIVGVGRMAHRIEDIMDFAAQQGGRLPPALGHDLEQATATLDQMIYALRGEEEPPTRAREQLQRLLDWIRVIQDEDWDALAQAPQGPAAAATAPTAATAAPAAAAAALDLDLGVAPAPAAIAATAAKPTPATDTPEPQLRVAKARLDRLLRGAGQSLVSGGRIQAQWQQLDERLLALTQAQQALQGDLAALQRALERQGVGLQAQAQAQAGAGGGFDPLELDRYNEVLTQLRFVAERVSDENELTRAAREHSRQAHELLREQGELLKAQHQELQSARLVPFAQIVARLRRTVAQTASTLGRRAQLLVEGEDTRMDSNVLEGLTEPLLHLLRNAVDHGLENAEERELLGKPEMGTVRLTVRRDGQSVQLVCEDDGRGIDLAAVHQRALALGLLAPGVEPDEAEAARLILLPGFSTRDTVTEVSGRGVGMDVVAERLRALKGQIDISTRALEGTRITLSMPASGGALHALVVRCGDQWLALPTAAVRRAVAAGQGGVDGLGDIEQVPLATLLGMADSNRPAHERPAVVVNTRRGPLALQVDELLQARELVLQELGLLLRDSPLVMGAALRPDGQVMFVLDAAALRERGAHTLPAEAAAALRQRATTQRQRVLVVDDAISVRKAVSQLLQDGGYEVLTARDGLDALRSLNHERVDLVLTDLEMPNLNGLELTERLRRTDHLAELPVVMITSRSADKHRDAAKAAGVSHYLTKPYTDAALLALVHELV